MKQNEYHNENRKGNKKRRFKSMDEISINTKGAKFDKEEL
jgi:hypothetical protein